MEIASLCEISNLPYRIGLKGESNCFAGVSVQAIENDKSGRSAFACVRVIYLVLAIDRVRYKFCRDTALGVSPPVEELSEQNNGEKQIFV
jgi:hypothetical protein